MARYIFELVWMLFCTGQSHLYPENHNQPLLPVETLTARTSTVEIGHRKVFTRFKIYTTRHQSSKANRHGKSKPQFLGTFSVEKSLPGILNGLPPATEQGA